jgi:two-component system cell cycle sensor histidine kinase/response regulator CckA
MTGTDEPLVLVVDDDAMVRRVLRLTLERAGLRVLMAEHGVDALNQLAGLTEPVRVLLTDIVMPEMGGVALAERVLTRPSPPKIILMSGFNHSADRLTVSGQTPPFVQKPFKGDEIAQLVWSVMGIRR